MPGLTISVHHDLKMLQASFHDFKLKHHKYNLLLNTLPQFSVCSFAWPHYPLRQWNRSHHHVIFEGMVYPYREDVLEQTFFSWFDKHGFNAQKMEQWVNSQDGEFIVLLVNSQTQQGVVLNDRFGRLPLYLLKEGRKLLITREISIANRLTTTPEADETGQLQTLLFGFPLGTRTLRKRVERVAPFSQLNFDLLNGRIIQHSSFEPGFGHKRLNPAILAELTGSLHEALQHRLDALPNAALSLSGGLDSRLLAALSAQIQPHLPLITYHDVYGSSDMDVEIAKQIAQRLQAEDRHQVLQLEEVNINHTSMLLAMKQGLNGLDMTFILPFLAHFYQNALAMLTGDGGDKTLDDLRPPVHPLSSNHLLVLLLQKHQAPDLEVIARMLVKNPKVIRDELSEEISALSQQKNELRYQEFLIRERAMHWLFEGEDRNRHYCWTSSPYYHPHFWATAMQLHMRDKAGGKVFKQILQTLPGQLGQLQNPNWKASLNQTTQIKTLFLKQSVKHWISMLYNRISAERIMSFEQFSHEKTALHLLPLLPAVKEHSLFQNALKERLSLTGWIRLMGVLLADHGDHQGSFYR